jgi:hypothetical protein
MYFRVLEMHNFQKKSRKREKLVANRDIPKLIDKTSNFDLEGK